jgi:hypothetical protein
MYKILLPSALLTLCLFSCRHKCTCTYYDPYYESSHSELVWIEGGFGSTKKSAAQRCEQTEQSYKQTYPDAVCVSD